MQNNLRNPIVARRAKEQADIWAEVDKSDPFTRDRVMSHFDNGLTDYDGELVKEQRTYIGADGIEKVYSVDIGRNMKRP